MESGVFLSRSVEVHCRVAVELSCRVACRVPVEFPVELSRARPGLKVQGETVIACALRRTSTCLFVKHWFLTRVPGVRPHVACSSLDAPRPESVAPGLTGYRIPELRGIMDRCTVTQVLLEGG